MSQLIPANLKFTKEHEWLKNEGEFVTIGITDFAQSALGDIVFVELPEVGKNLSANQSFGVVESIKSVSDLYAPISGVVVERNENLVNGPELCNKDAYGSAWMIKLRPSNPSELTDLLSSTQYSDLLSTL